MNFRYLVEVEEGSKTTLIGGCKYSLDAITMAKNHIEEALPLLIVKVFDAEIGKSIGFAYLKKGGDIGWKNP